ncbi:MAG: putative S-layer protein [Candidatus Nanoarchaeia archaeon]
MKYKYFSILALSLVSFILLVSSASALTVSTNSLSAFTNPGVSQNLSVYNSQQDVNFNTNFSIASHLTDSNGNNYDFLINPTGSVNNVSSSGQASYNISLNPSISSGSFVYGNTYSETAQFNAINSSNSSIQSSIPVNLTYVKSFCQSGDLNDSNIQMNVYVTNTGSGTSSSSTNWNPLDTIQVQVQLYNYNSNFNLNNVVFNIGLFQQGTNNNIINEMNWQSGGSNSVQIGGISSNSNGQYTFTFKVDPSILSNNNGQTSYILMVEAYGNQFCVDHSTSLSSYGGSIYYTNIGIQSPDYNQAVVVDIGSLPLSTQVSCGQQVTLTPNIYNLGYNENSYSKGQVFVTMSIPQLGINENQTLYGDLNSGSSVQAPFTFDVPINAGQTTYNVYFRTYYGYNSQYSEPYFGDYQYVSQNTFNTLLSVQGNCVYATAATTQITAQLESGGKAGSPLVIKSTITNTGNTTVSYNFGLEEYSSWASVSDISPLNITLTPGQSQDITANLSVNSDASGDKSFYLDAYSNGYLITKQPLSISITPQFSLASITGGAISGDNWYLWGIGLLNVILILSIIIILVKVGKKK